MSQVVFMRAVNVGKHQRFSVSTLAKQLAALNVVNIGAVGTLVVHEKIAPAALREELWKRMPFKAKLMICPRNALLDLLKSESTDPPPVDGIPIERFVTALSTSPKKLPALPIVEPAGKAWQVKIVRVAGCLAVSHFRRVGKRLIYPNEVVEKKLGLSGTTRNWNTLLRIGDVLQA